MRTPVFDSDYYKHYYEKRATSVVTAAEGKREVSFVLAFCRYIGLDIERFADVGAGTGWWAREFGRQYPQCKAIETFDASPEAVRLYRHKKTPVQKLRGARADLIVCRDVLRYLDDTDAREGIIRLADKCRGVLYLHVITSDDDIDEEASDMSGVFRSREWYTRRLAAAGFRNVGMGLFVSHRLKTFDPFAIEVP